MVRDFSPELVADACGIEAGEIRRMARELAAAERAAVYARIGTCTQEFGTLASWLVDVLNVLTGNLDREGGAMFPLAAAGQRNASGTPGAGKGVRIGRWQSRVRGLPETYGELPVAVLAEEIETPGEGQVRALVTVAGNPVVSTPNSERLETAIEGLDFMLAVDIYVNETTRHADVVLPGARAAREVPLRPGALPARRAQRGQLLAARVRAVGTAGVGDLPAAGRRAGGTGAERRPRRARRPRHLDASSSARWATPAHAWPGASPPS